MKKLLQRVFGIAASAALLVTSGMTAFAAGGHAHHGGDTDLNATGQYKGTTTEPAYTITLTDPGNHVTVDSDAKYGAYQIFSGTVKGENYTGTAANPGTNGIKIPLTDIKWGNAFGDVGGDTTAQTKYYQNIVGFVIALAKAPSNETYNYAFKDFKGFEDTNADKAFIDDTGNLASRFVSDGTDITATSELEDLKKIDFDKLAVAVADVVTGKTDRVWLQAFTDILGGYESDTAAEAGTYKEGGFVHQYYGSTEWGKDTENQCTISVPAGYYMILDLSKEGADDEAYSARMLFVANNVTQELKSDVPTLDKEIVRNDATDTSEQKTDVVGVGDIVTYKLTGTLPSDYDNFTLGYQYIFTDTLSKGLTLTGTTKDPSGTATSKEYTDGSLTVKALGAYENDVWNPTADITIATTDRVPPTGHSHTDDTTYAYKATVEEKDGQQILTVTFPCLREIQVIKDGVTCKLGYDITSKESSKIYVTYNAKVNEDAIVKPQEGTTLNGNMNTAQLTYSNNPAAYDDTGSTTPKEATVYTFGLDIVKIDAADFLKNDSNPKNAKDSGLADAQFVMLRRTGTSEDGYQWQIAKFKWIDATAAATNGTVPDSFKANGYNTIFEWVDITGATAADYDKTWIFNTTDDAVKTDYSSNVGSKVDGIWYYNITSLDTTEKGALNVSGLDAKVEYTIVETVAPEYYARISPFTVNLDPATETDDDYNGKLAEGTKVTPEVETDKSFDFEHYVQLLDPKSSGAADDDGSANMLVANFKYVDLPSTGGVGTYWFYILGAGGLAISFLLFKMSKKKVA